ncbi:hypothetical protein [Indibacter alkaliphilus]|nr:hypothetical protein [Indibacter alkaliphilus]
MTEKIRPDFFYGNYNLQAISMNQMLDINDDGDSNLDFLGQLESLGSEQNNRMTFLEGENDEMFFNFYYPNVLTEQNGVPIIRFVTESVSLFVDFNENTNQFDISEQNPPNIEVGEIISLDLIDQLTLEVIINKNLYDFQENEWKAVTVNYQFVRGLIST